jgi:hypothetical protein
MTRTSTTGRFGLLLTLANGFRRVHLRGPWRSVRQRAAIQIGLFRNIGDFVYLPVATTGNLMRLVESGYTGFVDHDATAWRAFTIHAWGVPAIWLPTGVLFATLVMFVIDERKGIEP